MKDQLAEIPGLTDLQVEKQVLIPQLKIRLDYDRAASLGVAPGTLLKMLEALTEAGRDRTLLMKFEQADRL